MAIKISDELRQQIRAAKEADPSLSGSQLGRMFGVHKSTANVIVEDLATQFLPRRPENGQPTPPALTETSEITEDKWAISLPKTDIHTLEQLVAYCEIDLSVWEIDKFQCNKWAVGAKDANGDIQVTPLFQVKAFLKRKQNIVDAKAEIEALKVEAKLEMRVPTPVVYTTQDSDNALELLIPDLHIAKLAWGKETGFRNYDTDIALQTYSNAIDSLIQSASHKNLDQIVLGVGNDLLQADNIQGTTYSGTKVDVDSRYRKTYVAARKMMTEAIEKLRQIAPVEVKVVPGNHDVQSAFTLGDSLECRFHNYTDVTVDNNPKMHKIFEWGDVFLVLIHGHLGKHSDYGMWMASQYAVQFGRTKFREIHCGHKHTTSLSEKFGVRVRVFSSLGEADSWHADNLFVGNLKVAEGLLWNKRRGLTDQYYYTDIS